MGNGGVRDSFSIQMLSRPPLRFRRWPGWGSPRRRRAAPLCLPPRSRTPAAPARRACAPRAHVLVKDHLGDAVAVAQVDEDDAAMIAAAVHPAHQDHGLAFVGGAQRSAVCVRRRSPRKSNVTEVSISICLNLRAAAERCEQFRRASRSAARRLPYSSARNGRRRFRRRPQSG